MMAARQSLSNGAGAQQEDESSEGDSLPSPQLGTHAQSIFPLDSYRQAYLELHQASWVIQFPLVTECIEAAEEILGGVSRCNDDKYHVSEFVHNVLKDVMRKGVVESNHRTWSDSVKVALLECCIALSSACAKGLASLDPFDKDLWSPPHHLTQVRRLDVVAEMLEALSWTFDLSSSFAETFPRGYKIPSECMEKVHHSLSLMPADFPAFTTAIAAKFQEERGVHLTFQDDPHPVPVMFLVLNELRCQLDPDLRGVPLSDSDLCIVPHLLRQILFIVDAAGCPDDVFVAETRMAHVRIKFYSVLLAKRSFSLTVVLIQDINMLFAQYFAKDRSSPTDLKPFLEWMTADKVLQQLLGVNMHQRQYVDAIQKLLENMARVRALDTETTLKLFESMLQEGVMDVEKDNIARVLKRVVKIADPNVLLGVIESTDLAAMKTTSDATTVFCLLREIIEGNLCDTVVKQCLAKVWDDLLSSGRAHLMIHSCRSTANAPPSDDMMGDNMFAWLCVYADIELHEGDSTADPMFSSEYIYRCVDLLYKGKHQAVALHMLHSLLQAKKEHILRQNVTDPGFFDTDKAAHEFVKTLCEWLDKEASLAPRDDSYESTTESPSAHKTPVPSFAVTLQRWLDLIRFCVVQLRWASRKLHPLKAELTEGLLLQKLWHSAVLNLPPETPAAEVEASLRFIAEMCDSDFVDKAKLSELIHDNTLWRPTHTLSICALEHIYGILVHCNRFIRDTSSGDRDSEERAAAHSWEHSATPKGHIIGMGFVFTVLLDTQDEMVARKAAQMLVMIYISYAQSWNGFVKDVVQRLCQYAYMYSSGRPTVPSGFTASDWQKLTTAPTEQGTSGSQPGDERNQLCRRLCRCLWLVHAILDRVYGTDKPVLLPHFASAKGRPAEIQISLQNGLALVDGGKSWPGLMMDKSQRVLGIRSHLCMYFGDLRKILEQVCGCSPTLVVNKRMVQDGELLFVAAPFEELSDGSCRVQVHALLPNDTQPPDRHQGSDLQEIAPDAQMADNSNFIHLLLHLVDAPNATAAVHCLAYKALSRVHTWPEVATLLKDFCAELTPGGHRSETAKRLFFIPSAHQPDAQPQPAALLYTFEALYALMEPASNHSNQSPRSLEVFSCPNTAVNLIIQAAQANYTDTRKDKSFWLQYHHTVMKLLKWIVLYSGMPDTTEVSHSAADSSKGGQENSDAGKSPDSSEGMDAVAGAEDAVGKVGVATVSIRESSSSSDRLHTHLVPASCGTLQMSTLETLQDFWMSLAMRFSNGLPTQSPVCVRVPWQSPGLELSESRLLDDVMRRITDLVQAQPTLLDSMLFGDSFACMADQLFFASADEKIRLAMRTLVCKCVDMASPASRCHLLKCMTSVDAVKLASTAPGSNLQFYLSLSHIVVRLSDPPHEESVPLLEQLLLDELELLRETRSRKDPTHGEQQLTGHLTFLTSLWTYFLNHPPQQSSTVTSAMRNTQNVSLLIDRLLFPEAQTLSKIRASGLSGMRSEVQCAFQPICTSQESRSAAYKLLTSAVTTSTESMQCCLHRFLEMLEPGPQSYALLKQQHADHACREDNSMQCKRYRGLQNAGATCYMNAIFQQLYMQPTVRALVLKSLVPGGKLEENVFFQIQRMFAHLTFSHARSFTPEGIWRSMRDLEGQPINVMEHQDAHEFLYQLHEIIDGSGQAGKPATKPLFAAMGGTSVQSIRCQTVDYESRKVEEFTHISVDVQSMHNLQRALDVYFQEELMEGDNAYHCDKVDAKVPAIKRTLLERLPHTFVVQLKRFEFDFANGLRVKIQERFEFPTHLNLQKYTDAAQSDASRPTSANYFEYELKGIVVHTGNAFAGHYFSFVKERGEQGNWLCMDDTSVTLWNPDLIDECCFGGTAPGGQVRPNSAYMLVYERKDCLEPIDVQKDLQALRDGQQLIPLSDMPVQGGDVQTTAAVQSVGQSHNDAEVDAHGMARNNGAAEQCESQQYVQDSVVRYGLPWALYAEVMQQNMLMAHASHWTSAHHMRFLKDVVATCLDITQTNEGDVKQLRRSLATGSNSGLKSMSCESRETTPSKRFAADGGLGSVPIPLTLSSAPGESKEELATQLSLKFCLSVLNYLPEVDDDLLNFFFHSALEGMRSFATEACVDLVYNSLTWRLPYVSKSQYFHTECGALHPDKNLRVLFAETFLRVVQTAVPELTQGDLCCKEPYSRPILRKVYRLLDLVWRIFKDYFTTKMVVMVESLMEAMAELASDVTLRCIMDQTMASKDMPHPVHLLVIALPQVLTCNPFDSSHANRTSTHFWRLMRAMIFSPIQPHGPHGVESISLRSCLRSAREIPDEDAFLAARIPDGSQLTTSLIACLAQTSVLWQVLDNIRLTVPVKNFEVHEFWIGPYLALSHARPDQFLVLLAPVMDLVRDVVKADEEDLDIYEDCAHLLMYYMVVLPMDASRQRRLKIAFLAGLEGPPQGRVPQLGLYVLVERALRLGRTQRWVPVQRMCKLLGQCVQHLHGYRPQDLQIILPAPALCRRVMDIVHNAYNTLLNCGAQGSGRIQEPLSQLYSLLSTHASPQQGDVPTAAQSEQGPSGSGEEE